MACIHSTATPSRPSSRAPSLRELAEARGLWIGTAVQADPLLHDARYAEILRREFNLLATENALKFGPLRPGPDRYDFREADAIVEFARANRMRVRGHTLVWKRQLPDWLISGDHTREELIAILRDHIHEVVGRYRDRIHYWDVVNEAIQVQEGDTSGVPLRRTLWLEGIGPDYIELAFRFAHEADPQAKLFYNDGIGRGTGPKAQVIYDLVRGLVEREVPVHGVGLQMHERLNAPRDSAAVAGLMRRLGELGLEVHVTELDVAVESAAGSPEEQQLRQADVYRQILGACLAVPSCTAFVTWGFTDRYSWLHPDTPLPFDADYQPKPAYRALRDALRRP
jgi:endo-1,4-beta-xylanase